jgi:ppGpp synthetase/RelA/SpoT-type nucleotidyltranferase
VGRIARRAKSFLRGYAGKLPVLEAAASEAEKYVRTALAGRPIGIHAITSRAKRITSLRSKLHRKNYSNPATQLTDLIGVRVITYFARDIDSVGDKLRDVLEISSARSKDARTELESNEFGYRSLHLVCRLRARQLPTFQNLGRRWFEIQIRSILDHAWSEIEHEVVYKSGIEFPDRVRRQFSAVAGSLEVIERAFGDLSAARDSLIDEYRNDYRLGRRGDERFDVGRLWGYLEAVRSAGLGWRTAEQGGNPFPIGFAVSSIDALDAAGLHTANRLERVFNSSRYKRAVRDFAAGQGIAPEETSHLALIVLAVAITKPQVARIEFPELISVPAIAELAGLSDR